MTTKLQSNQMVNEAPLKSLGQASRSEMKDIVESIQKEVDVPLRIHASFPAPDARVNFSDSFLVAADGAKKVMGPTGNLVHTLSGAFINFQTQAVSNAANFEVVWPVTNTVGRFRRIGFALNEFGKIVVLFSTEQTTLGAVINPGALFVTGTPLGYIEVECTNSAGYFKTVGSSTNIIENASIFRFAAGAGGGAASAIVKEETVTGQAGTTVTFVETFAFDGKAQFFRNGIRMKKVAVFSVDFVQCSQEYQEVNAGALSTQITLNPLTPAVASDEFSFYYVK